MITQITPEGVTIIKADEGKWLQKGELYSNTNIYLGKDDLPSNWIEVNSEPIVEKDQTPDEVIKGQEALV